MAWKALDTLLLALQQQPSWEAYRQYQHLLQVWEKVVEPRILAVTKPLALRRQVFWVATITPVWAQTLTLQRYPLLKQLNRHLAQPLLDLRFSAAQGYQIQDPSPSPHRETVEPPSRSESAIAPSLPMPNLADSSRPPKTPMEAFERWKSVLQDRAERLPACPRCQSPTLPQDLERWSVCSSCVRQRWH